MRFVRDAQQICQIGDQNLSDISLNAPCSQPDQSWIPVQPNPRGRRPRSSHYHARKALNLSDQLYLQHLSSPLSESYSERFLSDLPYVYFSSIFPNSETDSPSQFSNRGFEYTCSHHNQTSPSNPLYLSPISWSHFWKSPNCLILLWCCRSCLWSWPDFAFACGQSINFP